jgi:hypothetical protein
MTKSALTIFLCLATLASATASPNEVRRAKRAIADIKRSEKALAQSVKKLSQDEKKSLKSLTRGVDSDGDGLADVLEEAVGSNRCSADSDNDGLDDNEDLDEDNNDSDRDGVPDGMEIKSKGRVVSFNDPILVVDSATLQITATTIFFRGVASKADLVAGLCVEAESHRVDTLILVDKIKRLKDSECRPPGGNDD